MDAEEEQAFAESIERKMDHVIQSMRTQKHFSYPETRAQKSKSTAAIEPFSPVTPGAGTSSVGSGLTSATEKQIESLTGGETPGLSLSADNFEETFSEGSENDDAVNDGMPVDSMLNFIPSTNQSGGNKGEARRKERGVISAHGAEEKDTRRPTVKIRIPPREVEDEVKDEGDEVEEGVEKGVEETKLSDDVKGDRKDELPRKKKSWGEKVGKAGKAGTPKGTAGRLMKKLTSGFRRKRSNDREY